MLISLNADNRGNPKKVHSWLRALGRSTLPAKITVTQEQYELVRIFKHDFFAATGLYDGPGGMVVLKIGRESDFLGLPLAWLGRWLTRREAAIYRRLSDVPGVPHFVQQEGKNGLVHVYAPGHPLQRHERVNDQFFDRLQQLLDELHGRDIAYVDLNKRDNIIVGDDGRPYLIDFQISLCWPAVRRKKLAALRWLLSQFQKGDLYHLAKHIKRHRPNLMRPEHQAMLRRGTNLVRWHRWFSGPFRQFRRQTLKRLGQWREQETGDVA